jgi:hypothetical protein
MPTIAKEIQQQRAARAVNPPAPPCPQYPSQSCTPLPETPATTLPFPGNMAYYGGHVQVTPKEYLVYWGWGQSGAWPNGTTCTAESITEGSFSATIPCDPDGAGKYVADFVQQMGGTAWAGVQTQYFQTDSSGAQQNITNPSEQLAGIWADDSDANTLPKTSMTNAAGPTNTLTALGQEAQAAIAHFGITDLANSNIVIVQPPGLSDPNALSQGYCAFHDYTEPGVESGAYNGLQQGIAYSNIPYQLAINSGGANVCGENAVNSDARGKLDGFSIVTGHPRRQRERRQVRVGRREPAHRNRTAGADPRRNRQHDRQRRRQVRRPVAVEQRSQRRHRLLRGRGDGLPDPVVVAAAG